MNVTVVMFGYTIDGRQTGVRIETNTYYLNRAIQHAMGFGKIHELIYREIV